MTKVILISQFPLPYLKIGSWTTLYKNYLEGNHQIDYIVCEKPEAQFEDIKYSIVANTLFTKVLIKLQKKPYLSYISAIEKIIQTEENYIIQIVDNFGIVTPLMEFLTSKGLRKKCYLQFFYHGYPPFYGNFESRYFFENIDEMILLTHDSYKVHKEQYTILPTRFSILHNGIDTSQFFSVSNQEKQALKKQKNVLDKTVFVWCSQDRSKKGLFLIMDAWKQVYAKRRDIVLWVIGCQPKDPIEGVKYMGSIPNHELAVYFQTSDCYLFPTLWHEGFGMSLIEALHCGNYCIASSIGGVPEVLQYGKLGQLIENPHFIQEWVNAILNFIDNPQKPPNLSPKLYSSESWSNGMNSIIDEAKKSL
jgi:glycosyltransferase involved in cell wall biosynthesis